MKVGKVLYAPLNASSLIMRPEPVTEEHLDLCPVQTDCRYDEARLRASGRVPEAEHIGGASGGNSAIEPAITPVNQAKAVDLTVIAQCLDQTLPSSCFARPSERKGRVKGKLHLVLQVEISVWHQGEQEVDPTDQPLPSLWRVEVRVR